MRRRAACILPFIIILVVLLACTLPSAGPAPVVSPTIPISSLPTAPATARLSPVVSPTIPISSLPTAPATPRPSPVVSPTIPISSLPTAPATPRPVYGSAFGIDYAHPEKYQVQGEQSRISDPAVLEPLRRSEQSLAHLGDIYRWLAREFTAYSAGGKTIGVVTVDQLLAQGRLGGCHDFALVYAAAARELGYPAVMARTDSISWVKRFQAGEQGPYVGHVFVEVYLAGRWVLVDSTNGWYVADGYDPAQPVIPLKELFAETYGLYVERKGLDIWGFGIHSPAESNQAMEALARQFNLDTLVYPRYVFQRFAR